MQLELDIPDRPRLVKGDGGMYYVLPAGDTLEAFRREYGASKLEVVDWPERVRFR